MVIPAAATEQTPVSGDPRAVAYTGNAQTCADAGLSGATLPAHRFWIRTL